MRLNQFLARHTDLSRRSADAAISEGRVEINGVSAKLGDTVIDSDKVTLDSHIIKHDSDTITIMLHKPVGYVCSRNGQGSQTIYDILPAKYHHLNPVGRLDKDSSGLLLLTNNGEIAQQMSHPSYQKDKRYTVTLDKRLTAADKEKITQEGVSIGDARVSKFRVQSVTDTTLHVYLQEGRNRQIRRTFEALGYKVIRLHRTHFGEYALLNLKQGDISVII
jgi:23S rRNA pseudouridine2605 synthase